MLADADYDVWLGNFRGSFYGRRHKTLRAADPKFWDFSFHENGVHDVAGTLDYVARATGQDSVLYVGHSMGGTALLALLAERPQYNARVRAAFLLAPAAYFHYVRGSFKQTRRRMRWGYVSITSLFLRYGPKAGDIGMMSSMTLPNF
ncbi:lipase 3-like [Frankliniella occidentalis]|uniref:Lipase 3-like n=1 Tax=Frankliniella occidentalis TaxID=133901 RepID=A0A9C6X0Z4_FRAOC|nr:lipase 3-like [Frankliniella occidentalis]